MFSWFRSQKVILTLMVFVIMLGLTGCRRGGARGDGNGLSGNIQVAGSTSVQPISEELATAFMDINPDVTIDVAGGGSSAGIKAANEGTANIGASSRNLNDEEKGLGLTETIIAKDGIAVIVNPANTVTDLTLDEVRKIYTGEITNWQDVGGKDAPIIVVNREEGSGTRGAFEEIVIGDGEFTDKAAVQNSTGAVRTTVAQDENAIGYISMGTVGQDVKAISIDGVEPTAENVINDSYKIARPFLYLTKDNDKVTQAFIGWVLSSEGQEIVGQGFIPVK